VHHVTGSNAGGPCAGDLLTCMLQVQCVRTVRHCLTTHLNRSCTLHSWNREGLSWPSPALLLGWWNTLALFVLMVLM
jgi:hypothetical protein